MAVYSTKPALAIERANRSAGLTVMEPPPLLKVDQLYAPYELIDAAIEEYGRAFGPRCFFSRRAGIMEPGAVRVARPAMSALTPTERKLLVDGLAALLTAWTRCHPTDEETAQAIIALARKISTRQRCTFAGLGKERWPLLQ